MSHSPTPWVTHGYNVRGPDGKLICRVTCSTAQDRREARDNALHIVKCVNAHDELLASVIVLLAFAELVSAADVDNSTRDMLDKARAALAKVGAE